MDEYWHEFEQLYRYLAKQWHPDLQPLEQPTCAGAAGRRELATRRMQWLNAIYKEARDSYLQMVAG